MSFIHQALGGYSDLYEIDTRAFYPEVLFVDDSPHAALLGAALRERVGSVFMARSVVEALEVLQESSVDLVITALTLPDAPGLLLLRALRDLRPALPIVVSAWPEELSEAVQALREGAWDFLSYGSSEGDRLEVQLEIVLRRTAQRKIHALQEMRVRAERDAFYIAALSAQDGLAILSENANLLFGNEAFRNFLNVVRQNDRLPVNLVELISQQNQLVAQDLGLQLKSRAGDYLWRSELEVLVDEMEPKPVIRHFELTLVTVTPRKVESLQGEPETGFAETFETAPDALSYRVLWVRDTTRRKEQEKFQRDLLSTTTHDLKGPLSSILASAEMLSETPFAEQQGSVQLLTRIASCARNSIDIIDELLSARRIQDGVLVVKPRYYLVDEILEDIVLDYIPLAKARRIKFSTRPTDEGLEVFADKQGLNRVLGNLVNNALKFTPEGGRVEVYAKSIRSGVRIYVSDTGPGIEAHARHKLFERFARLEKHSDIEGTGLGLFVSKNIIDAHNGKIDVQSEVGQGTTFIVTLPDQDASLS